MSRFFGNKSSSSSSSSDSEEEEKKPVKKQLQAKKYQADDSDVSEEEDRVVRKKEDKFHESLNAVFDKMKNHIKINDFTSLTTDFDDLISELNKSVGVTIATDKLQTLPTFILKNLAALEDCINEVSADEKKKMNKTNSQAYNKMRQRLKKFLAETGDAENLYEKQLQKYRENPPADEEGEEKDESEESSDDSDSSSDDSSSSDESDKPKKPKAAAKKKSDSSSSSDDDKSSSDSSSSSSDESGSDSDGSGSEKEASDEESEEELQTGQLPKKYAFLALPRDQITPAQRRWKWVKFECLPEEMKKFIRPPKAEKEVKIKDPTAVKKPKAEVVEQVVEIEEDNDLDFTKMDNVEKTLTKLKNQQTSRKNFNIENHIEIFNMILVAQAQNLNLSIEVTMLLISTFFMEAKSNPQGIFTREQWIRTNNKVTDLLNLLQNKVFNKDEPKKVEEDGGDLDSFMKSSDQQILPALVTFIEKLDQQLFKAVQNLTQTDMEYLYRLRDECLLTKQCDAIMEYLSKQSDQEKQARVGLIKLERIYYKHDSLYEKTRAALKGQTDKLNEIYFLEEPSQDVV